MSGNDETCGRFPFEGFVKTRFMMHANKMGQRGLFVSDVRHLDYHIFLILPLTIYRGHALHVWIGCYSEPRTGFVPLEYIPCENKSGRNCSPPGRYICRTHFFLLV